MTNSSLMKDYIGYGLLSARPATPPTGSGIAARYYATDTATDYLWTGSAWAAATGGGGGGGGGGGAAATKPLVADFTIINQQTATIVDGVKSIIYKQPMISSTPILYKTAPSFPCSLYAKFGFSGQNNVANSTFGIALGNSTSGKWIILGADYSGAQQSISDIRMTNAATFSGAVAHYAAISHMPWWRMDITSTTARLFIGSDGYDYIDTGVTLTHADFIGTCDRIGFGGYGNNTYTELVTSWSFTAPV